MGQIGKFGDLPCTPAMANISEGGRTPVQEKAKAYFLIAFKLIIRCNTFNNPTNEGNDCRVQRCSSVDGS